MKKPALCLEPVKGRSSPHWPGGGTSSAALLPPWNSKKTSYAHVQLGLHCLGESKRATGVGCTGRHRQEVACPSTIISASAALSLLSRHVSDWFAVVVMISVNRGDSSDSHYVRTREKKCLQVTQKAEEFQLVLHKIDNLFLSIIVVKKNEIL